MSDQRPLTQKEKTRAAQEAIARSQAGLPPGPALPPQAAGGSQKTVVKGVVVLVVVIASVVFGLGSMHNSDSPGDETSAQAVPTAEAFVPAPETTALSTSGNGTKNTDEFNATGHWRIAYTFDCSAFGSSGNFQIYVYGDDGLVDVAANALAASGADTTYETSIGTTYLKVNSECAWTVDVVVN